MDLILKNGSRAFITHLLVKTKEVLDDELEEVAEEIEEMENEEGERDHLYWHEYEELGAEEFLLTSKLYKIREYESGVEKAICFIEMQKYTLLELNTIINSYL